MLVALPHIRLGLHMSKSHGILSPRHFEGQPGNDF